MLEIKNLYKSYGNSKVIENISLKFPKGKFCSILGANGTGKSTLLNCMGRLISPDSGEVLLNEKPLESWNNNLLSRELAILKQSNSITANLSVKELVSLGRFPYSGGYLNREDEEYIGYSIEYTGLDTMINKQINELSGGQRQRAFIAMIIAQNTKIILLDEPLNNLDMKHSVQIMELLKKLSNEQNKTIITVQHDINIASVYSDHIVALKKRNVLFNGDSETFMDANILSDIFDIKFDLIIQKERKLCLYY